MIRNQQSVAAHPMEWMAGLGMWGFFVTLGRGAVLLSVAESDPQYHGLWLLPLTSNSIYVYLLRRLLLGDLWLLMEFGLLYGLIAAATGNWGMAILCTMLQGIVGVALPLWITRERSRSGNLMLTLLLLSLVPATMMIAGSKPTAELGAQILYVCNPLGWTNAIFAKGITGWWGFVPTVVLLATVPFSLKAVRRLNADGFFRENRLKAAGRVGKNDVVGNPSIDWAELGFVERLLARFLNREERVVAQALLIRPPRWSGAFYGMSTYAVLFLIASSFIYFQSLEDIVAGIMNYDARAGAAFVGCIGSGIFFALMATHGLVLFHWGLWPEGIPLGRVSSEPRRSYPNFRMFPISYWEVVKVLVKVDTILVLLVLPLAVLTSFTPMFQSLEYFRRGVGLMPKCLIGVWAVALLAASWKLFSGLDDWQYWRSWLIAAAASVTICGLAMALVVSPMLMWDLVLIGVLVVIAPAWVTFAGYRYCRGFR